MSTLDDRLKAQLAQIRAAELYRTRRIVEGGHGVDLMVDGRRCINFCSNDYLGLAADPRVAEAARSSLARSGTGSGAAALVSGYDAEHARLEEEVADFVGRPRALLFSSGWAANLGVMRALLRREDTLIADELNHASLIDGGRLAGARYLRVRHRDIDGFEQSLAHSRPRPQASGLALVVTDSIFSMDGDLADLPTLSTLCATHDASLMVDDAHGFGVIGKGGRGVLHHDFAKGGAADADIYVATLGKSLGAAGAFVAGSEALIEYLVQRARTWVFSTAPPPAIAAAARAALHIVQAEPERRAALFSNIQHFRRGAAQLGLDGFADAVDSTATPIQPLIVGDAAQAVALSQTLYAQGFWVAAIRPPTVPAGTSRLRITLSAAHTPVQIDGLLDALSQSLGATRAVAA
jgi:8-amino-7-oxononanoate synthase